MMLTIQYRGPKVADFVIHFFLDSPITRRTNKKKSSKPVVKTITYHRRVVKSDEERRHKIEYRDSQYK